MTSEEKAEELFTTYRFCLSIPNAPLGDLKDSIAKQCALIAVDEVVDEIISFDSQMSEAKLFDKDLKYWKEVKEEIEKL